VGKSSFVHDRNRCHTCCVKRQWVNRCVQSSADTWQRGQVPLFGHPRRSRLSAVRQRLCTTNHIKNLHFMGALDFQMGLAHANEVLAMKNSLYAELTENSPSVVHLQMALSGLPATSMVLVTMSQSCRY
jgi:hypothetical protein